MVRSPHRRPAANVCPSQRGAFRCLGAGSAAQPGPRDRALIGLMVYTFARIGAALKMTIEDDGTVKAADGRTHNVNWRVTGQTGEHGMAHLVRMVHA